MTGAADQGVHCDTLGIREGQRQGFHVYSKTNQ